MFFLLTLTPSKPSDDSKYVFQLPLLEKTFIFLKSFQLKKKSFISLYLQIELQSTWFWLTNLASGYNEGIRFQARLPDHQSPWPEWLGQGLVHDISWSKERNTRVLVGAKGTKALSWIWSWKYVSLALRRTAWRGANKY